MKKPLVSVVIPVYNVEKVLKRCVDSVLDQTYPAIEIILVNDGSTDCSGEICEQYKDNCSNVKVIHKENGGVSSARNAGLEKITGEYVTFVDSDDWLEKNAIEVYVSTAIKEKCDLVASNYYIYDGQKHIAFKENEISSNDFIENALLERISTSVWAKLIHSSLLSDPYKIEFEIGRRYEDTIPSICLFKRSKKAVYISEPLYVYVQFPNSIVYNPKNSDINDLIHNTETLSRILFDYEQQQFVYSYIISTLVFALQLWYRVGDYNKYQYEIINNYLNIYRKKIYLRTIFSSRKWKKLLLVKLKIYSRIIGLLEERRKKC